MEPKHFAIPCCRYYLTDARGAVKSNVGHLEGASGLAGVIKTLLVLERALIPPNANLERLNPKINECALNIKACDPTHLCICPSNISRSFRRNLPPGQIKAYAELL